MSSTSFFVTFYPLIAFEEEWNEAYSDISREVEIVLEHGPDLLEEFLRERRGYYETILVSRPHNMQVLFPILEKHPDWFENVTVIYDAEAVFATRDIARRKLAGSPMTEVDAAAAVKDEIKLAAAANLVISVSEAERETFVKNGIGRVEVLGHALQTQASPNAFGDGEGFLFVGAIEDGRSEQRLGDLVRRRNSSDHSCSIRPSSCLSRSPAFVIRRGFANSRHPVVRITRRSRRSAGTVQRGARVYRTHAIRCGNPAQSS